MTNIRLENVTASYSPGMPVLSQLSLEIESGQLVMVIGPSGCGKTTLLRIVAGLKRIDAGEVYFDNINVKRVPPHQRDIAMVFQADALYSHLSVERNLSCGLRTGRNEGQRNHDLHSSRIQKVAYRLGIDGLFPRKPFQLSGGERQRVALARALVRDPAAFLLDEPLSNLDAARKNDLRQYIQQLQRERKTTTLFVTHSQDEAMMLADQIAVIHRGQLQQFGTPAEIYNYPQNQFVASFFGTPAMNFFKGKMSQQGDDCFFENAVNRWKIDREAIDSLAAKSGGHELTLGVRPEDISITPFDASNMTGVVVNVAFLGRQKIVNLKIEKPDSGKVQQNADSAPLEIVATVGTEFVINRQDRVSVSLNQDKLHFFDSRTGQAI